MSKVNEIATAIFSVIAAVLISNNSLRIGLAVVLILSCFGIWAKEICNAIRR